MKENGVEIEGIIGEKVTVTHPSLGRQSSSQGRGAVTKGSSARGLEPESLTGAALRDRSLTQGISPAPSTSLRERAETAAARVAAAQDPLPCAPAWPVCSQCQEQAGLAGCESHGMLVQCVATLAAWTGVPAADDSTTWTPWLRRLVPILAQLGHPVGVVFLANVAAVRTGRAALRPLLSSIMVDALVERVSQEAAIAAGIFAMAANLAIDSFAVSYALDETSELFDTGLGLLAAHAECVAAGGPGAASLSPRRPALKATRSHGSALLMTQFPAQETDQSQGVTPIVMPLLAHALARFMANLTRAQTGYAEDLLTHRDGASLAGLVALVHVTRNIGLQLAVVDALSGLLQSVSVEVRSRAVQMLRRDRVGSEGPQMGTKRAIFELTESPHARIRREVGIVAELLGYAQPRRTLATKSSTDEASASASTTGRPAPTTVASQEDEGKAEEQMATATATATATAATAAMGSATSDGAGTTVQELSVRVRCGSESKEFAVMATALVGELVQRVAQDFADTLAGQGEAHGTVEEPCTRRLELLCGSVRLHEKNPWSAYDFAGEETISVEARVVQEDVVTRWQERVAALRVYVESFGFPTTAPAFDLSLKLTALRDEAKSGSQETRRILHYNTDVVSLLLDIMEQRVPLSRASAAAYLEGPVGKGASITSGGAGSGASAGTGGSGVGERSVDGTSLRVLSTSPKRFATSVRESFRSTVTFSSGGSTSTGSGVAHAKRSMLQRRAEMQAQREDGREDASLDKDADKARRDDGDLVGHCVRTLLAIVGTEDPVQQPERVVHVALGVALVSQHEGAALRKHTNWVWSLVGRAVQIHRSVQELAVQRGAVAIVMQALDDAVNGPGATRPGNYIDGDVPVAVLRAAVALVAANPLAQVDAAADISMLLAAARSFVDCMAGEVGAARMHAALDLLVNMVVGNRVLAERVRWAGALALVTTVLALDESPDPVLRAALRLLDVLTMNSADAKDTAQELGAVSQLLCLAQESQTKAIVEAAWRLLARLLAGSSRCTESLVACGGVSAAAHVVVSKGTAEEDCSLVLDILLTLMRGSTIAEEQAAVQHASALAPVLVFVLQRGAPSERLGAAEVLELLAKHHSSGHPAVVAAGAIPAARGVMGDADSPASVNDACVSLLRGLGQAITLDEFFSTFTAGGMSASDGAAETRSSRVSSSSRRGGPGSDIVLGSRLVRGVTERRATDGDVPTRLPRTSSPPLSPKQVGVAGDIATLASRLGSSTGSLGSSPAEPGLRSSDGAIAGLARASISEFFRRNKNRGAGAAGTVRNASDTGSSTGSHRPYELGDPALRRGLVVRWEGKLRPWVSRYAVLTTQELLLFASSDTQREPLLSLPLATLELGQVLPKRAPTRLRPCVVVHGPSMEQLASHLDYKTTTTMFYCDDETATEEWCAAINSAVVQASEATSTHRHIIG